jgi:peptidoglycan/LPS O-acetylase OafA/YrhL
VTPEPAAPATRDADIPALTGLRAVAALAVVLAHGAGLILRFEPDSRTVVYWAEQASGFGMSLFFVLSGFVIHYNYRRVVTTGGLGGIAWFIWARFARLYPLFLLVLLFDVLFSKDLYKWLAGVPTDIGNVIHALPYFLTFTQSWVYVPFDRTSLVYAIGVAAPLTWSISTEWFFYLCYPLFAGAVATLQRPRFIAAALFFCAAVWIALAIGVVDHVFAINEWAVIHYGDTAGFLNGNPATLQDSFVRWLIYFSPYFRIGEFLTGGLLCQVYVLSRTKPVSASEHMVGNVALWAGIATVPVVTYVFYQPRDPGASWLGDVLSVLSNNYGFALVAALLIFCAARYDGVVTRALSGRAMVQLGEASYSTYLIHLPILVIAGSYIGYELPATLSSIGFQMARLVSAIAIILAIALGLNKYVEIPSRRWLRRLWANSTQMPRWRTALSVVAVAGCMTVLVVLAVPSSATPTKDAASPVIRVISATYGKNCSAGVDNATADARKACNGQRHCTYVVDVERLGDPVSGCAKDFALVYVCSPSAVPVRKPLAAEAGLKSQILLDCPGP